MIETNPILRRPRSVSEMRESLSALHSDESLEAAAAFRPRPSDVFITPYPKSGTTWLQQIVHGLRSGGSMDFAEIGQVIPWLETCLDLGIDPEAEQPGGFRAFKPHWSGENALPGAKYIVAIRDPEDVLVSFHRFFEGWFFEAGAIDLPTFAEAFFLEGSNSGRYWGHVLSWWERRHEPEVLLLCFEEMRRDFPRALARIAAFLDIPLTPELQATVTTQSSLPFMKAHAHQFDDHLLREARNAPCGLPPGGVGGKVSRGRQGDGAARLSPGMRRILRERWEEVITPATGFGDYAALRQGLKALGEP